MKKQDEPAFENLFYEAYEKYFGRTMAVPLSENESQLFSKEIGERTGLLISPVNLSNYSAYILCTPESRQVYPSIATLDTLARYYGNAPVTNEEERKQNESHYPYWFRYKDSFNRKTQVPNKKKWLFPFAIIFMILALIAVMLVVFFGLGQTPPDPDKLPKVTK